MIASYQPTFGFPVDAGAVAYIVLVLLNGDCFKLSESTTGGGLVVKQIAKVAEDDETDNEQ